MLLLFGNYFINMNDMRTLTHCLLIGFILICSSCMQDSPLSDVEISDPSLIQPSISLYRTRDNSGILKTRIEVFLFDKNLNSVELKKGRVLVNGYVMQVKELPLTGGPYYTIDASLLKVELNKLYTFIIELADGKAYQGSVSTQETDIFELVLPKSYSRQNNMQISWLGHDISSDLKIELTCNYQTDIRSGQTNNSFTPKQQERSQGLYMIPSSYFNQEEGIYKATVTVTSKTTGVIDSRFRTYSVIQSIYIKESECNIN